MSPLDTHNPPTGSLNILHHNSRSLAPKLQYYTGLAHLEQYDVLSFSETWLKPAVPDPLIAIPNYALFRCDRHCGRKATGGGVAVYVRSSLEVEELTGLPDLLAGVDVVWLRVTCARRKLVVGTMYSPPDIDKAAFIASLSAVFDHSSFDNADVVLVGDININWNGPSSGKQQLVELANDQNLDQVFSGLSYVAASGRESLLDLGFVSRTVSVRQARILTVDPYISDHYATSLSLCVQKQRPPKRLITSRNIKKALPDIFSMGQEQDRDLLSQVGQLHSSSDQAALLEDWVLRVFDHYAPQKTIRLRPESPQWLTPELKKLVACKNRFFKTVNNNPNMTDKNWSQYKKFRNHVHSKLKQSRRAYHATQMSHDTSSFYKQVNTLLGRKPASHEIKSLRTPDGAEINDPASVAEYLNTFFTTLPTPDVTAAPKPSIQPPSAPFSFQPVTEAEVRAQLLKLDSKKRGGLRGIPAAVYKCLASTVVPALTMVVNTSFRTDDFPDAYKHAMVTPIFKKGNRTDPSNYRPISSLPILSKVIESLMNRQIHFYLHTHSLLSAKQFGFRQGVSTEHMLLTLCESHLQHLDSRTPKYIAQLGIDVRKAFDTVHHGLLLTKLESMFHFSENARLLVQSYLQDRTQTMRCGSSTSSSSPISKGVPQGSIIGPLLFNLMVNDMLETRTNILSYADDTILYGISNTQSSAIADVTARFGELQDWYSANGLSLCPEKTKCIVFSNRLTESMSFKLDNHDIRTEPSVKLLGVWLDSRLTFSHHIDWCTTAARSTIYALRRIRPFLNTDQCKLIYTSIIRPKLEYCSALFTSISKSLSTKLERTQNKAIRIICRAPSIFSVNHARPIVGLHTLASRRSHTFSRRIRSIYFSETHDSILYPLMTANAMSHKLSLRSRCNLSLPSVYSKFGLQTFTYQAIKVVQNDQPPLLFTTI